MLAQPIHNCLQANLENEYYKETLTEFYKENKKLKEQLRLALSENDKLKSVQIDISKTSDSSTQTNCNEESKKCSVCDKTNNCSKTSSLENDIYNKQNKKSYAKLCEMQHTLLKKYENEVNANAVKQDLINHMKLELDSLESYKNQYETENSKLQQKLDDLEPKYKSLLLDCETFRIKCKKYKNEMKCFDKSFFDELEQLKSSYDQSIKLNKHYENLLYKLNKNSLIVNKKVTFVSDKEPNDLNDSTSADNKSNQEILFEESDDLDDFLYEDLINKIND